MVNWDILSAIIFCAVLFFLFKKYRNKFEVQGKIFVMYKTKWGLNFMDWSAKKFPKTLNALSYVSVTVGFLGMLAVLILLIKGAISLIQIPSAQPMLAPVLPWIKIPGLPTLSFWHWIISILIVAVIHETCHGIYARLHNIKIKSSGFAFMGPILAAFVEPEEKQLNKSPKFNQLSMLSAGPFSNIVFGIIVILLGSLVLSPVMGSMLHTEGVQIISISPDHPINESALKTGDNIKAINDMEVKNVEDFIAIMSVLPPGEIIKLTTSNDTIYTPISRNPKNISQAMLGVSVTHSNVDIKESVKEKYGSFLPSAIVWISELVFWLYAISLGIGFFNLLPLGPFDGGKMFFVGAQYFTKDKKKAMKAFGYMTAFCILLLLLNILPYILQFLRFMAGPFL